MKSFTRLRWITLIWLTVGYAVIHGTIASIVVSSFAIRYTGADNLTVLADGELARLRFDGATYTNVLYDLNGNRLDSNKHQALAMDQFLLNNLNAEKHTKISGFNDGTPRHPTFWYAVEFASESGLYFVGYDPISKDVAGYIGRKGYSRELPKREDRFQYAADPKRSMMNRIITSGNYSIYSTTQDEPTFQRLDTATIGNQAFSYQLWIAEESAICEIDLRSHQVKEIYRGDKIEMGSLSIRSYSTSPDERSIKFIVLHDNKISQIDTAGREEYTISLPPEARIDHIKPMNGYYANFAVGKTTKDQMVLQFSNYDNEKNNTHFWWFDKDGNVARHETETIERNPLADWEQAVMPSFMVPVPAMFLLIFTVGPLISYSASTSASSLIGEYTKMWSQGWPALVLMIPIVLVVMWFVARHERKYLGKVRLAWLIGVALLGWPGLLAYWFHRQWTTLAQNGKPMPLPPDPVEKTGTEIFVSA